MQDSIDHEPSEPKKRSFVGRGLSAVARGISGITWLMVLVAGAILAFGYLYPQDYLAQSRPEKLLNCFAFGAQVLQFHIGVAAAVAMLVAPLIRRKGLGLFAGLVVAFGVGPTAMSWLPKDPAPAAGQTLRVHSVNILFMNYNPDKILAEIERVDADVIAFQEWHDWHQEYLLPELRKAWPYTLTFPDDRTKGMALLSKRPFLETSPDGQDWLVGEHGVRMQRAVIKHEGRPIAVYNVHPASPGNLRYAVWNHKQTMDMLEVIEAEMLPSIVIGDFNAHTATGNIELFRNKGFLEVQEAAGVGPGWTWPRKEGNGRVHRVVRNLPGVRIDHCLLSSELTATRAEVGCDHGSDHLGIFADVGWYRSNAGSSTGLTARRENARHFKP